MKTLLQIGRGPPAPRGLDISPAVKVASPASAKVEIDRLELFEPAAAEKPGDVMQCASCSLPAHHGTRGFRGDGLGPLLLGLLCGRCSRSLINLASLSQGEKPCIRFDR